MHQHFCIGFQKAVWYTFIDQDEGRDGLTHSKTNVVSWVPMVDQPLIRSRSDGLFAG